MRLSIHLEVVRKITPRSHALLFTSFVLLVALYVQFLFIYKFCMIIITLNLNINFVLTQKHISNIFVYMQSELVIQFYPKF